MKGKYLILLILLPLVLANVKYTVSVPQDSIVILSIPGAVASSPISADVYGLSGTTIVADSTNLTLGCQALEYVSAELETTPFGAKAVKVYANGGNGWACATSPSFYISTDQVIYFIGRGYVNARLWNGSAYVSELYVYHAGGWSRVADDQYWDDWHVFMLKPTTSGNVQLFLYNHTGSVGEEYAGEYGAIGGIEVVRKYIDVPNPLSGLYSDCSNIYVKEGNTLLDYDVLRCGGSPLVAVEVNAGIHELTVGTEDAPVAHGTPALSVLSASDFTCPSDHNVEDTDGEVHIYSNGAPASVIEFGTKYRISSGWEQVFGTCLFGEYVYYVGYSFDEGDGDTVGRSGLVVKVDKHTGEVISYKKYEFYDNSADDDHDYVYSCAVLHGKLYIGGHTNAFGNYGVYFAEIDPDTLDIVNISYINYQASYHDYLFDMVADPDRNILIGAGGYFNGSKHYLWIYEFDPSSGTLVRSTTVDGDVAYGCRSGSVSYHGNDVFNALDARDGKIVAVGWYRCLGDWGGDGLADDYDYRMVVVEFNETDLSVITGRSIDKYAQTWEGLQIETLQGVAIGDDGYIYAVGTYQGTGTVYRYYVVKLDNSLNIVGEDTGTSIWGNYNSSSRKILVIGDTLYVVEEPSDGSYYRTLFVIYDTNLNRISFENLDSGNYYTIALQGRMAYDPDTGAIYFGGMHNEYGDYDVYLFARTPFSMPACYAVLPYSNFVAIIESNSDQLAVATGTCEDTFIPPSADVYYIPKLGDGVTYNSTQIVEYVQPQGFAVTEHGLYYSNGLQICDCGLDSGSVLYIGDAEADPSVYADAYALIVSSSLPVYFANAVESVFEPIVVNVSVDLNDIIDEIHNVPHDVWHYPEGDGMSEENTMGALIGDIRAKLNDLNVDINETAIAQAVWEFNIDGNYAYVLLNEINACCNDMIRYNIPVPSPFDLFMWGILIPTLLTLLFAWLLLRAIRARKNYKAVRNIFLGSLALLLIESALRAGYNGVALALLNLGVEINTGYTLSLATTVGYASMMWNMAWVVGTAVTVFLSLLFLVAWAKALKRR